MFGHCEDKMTQRKKQYFAQIVQNLSESQDPGVKAV